jgi:8-oxo-dGTP diphosphatase
LNYAPVGFELLGDSFTLLELQRVHEAVLGRPLNKDSFRRRMLASGLLEPTGQSETGVGHRPASLYRFGGAVAPCGRARGGATSRGRRAGAR